jgi:hypothetical protein
MGKINRLIGLIIVQLLMCSFCDDGTSKLLAAERDDTADSAFDIPSKKKNFHIFLLMGQSNMAGFGGVAANDPWLPGDKDPVSHVLVLDGQGTHDDATPREPIVWRPGAHPLHLHQSTAQFGLGMDFAKEYIKSHPGVTVGLIPCAWGGDEISSLNKGSAIYANALVRIKVASQVGVISGVLWHQGESDTVDKTHADAYERRLRQLIHDLRVDCEEPQLPFIIGNLAEFYGVYPGHSPRIQLINQVRGILFRVANEEPNAGFVPTTGLESADKNYVHFNRSSYILLGQRYAQTLLQIQKKQKSNKID